MTREERELRNELATRLSHIINELRSNKPLDEVQLDLRDEIEIGLTDEYQLKRDAIVDELIRQALG